jgi:hypothetical protein
LPWLELRDLGQGQVAGQIAGARKERRSVIVIQVCGHVGESGRRCCDVFAPRAIDDQARTRSPDEHAITGLEIGAACLDHDAYACLPSDAGQVLGRGQVDVPGTECVVERIDPDRAISTSTSPSFG